MKHANELFQLNGKVAIVTGGRGLYGASISAGLCEMGATVIIASRNGEKCEEYAAELRSQGYSAKGLPLDLNDDASIRVLVETVIREYGKIDILVNNAGISKEMPFLDMPVEVFDEICETNLRSVMLMMKAVLPYMKEQKSGNVVNIGSGAAIRGLPGSAAYSVSKAGVICLTQAVGDEVRPFGIRINAICPGPVDTELFQKSERRNYILSAGGDLFKPETVANGVAFLASDLSEGMNSQVLIMRGFNRW